MRQEVRNSRVKIKEGFSYGEAKSSDYSNEFLSQYHRHHKSVIAHKFSVAAKKDGKIVGVAIVRRPVARSLDNVRTLEVTRLCTDRTRNACSFLYSKCAKIAKDKGYSKIVTYILESDPGTSLMASGWTLEEAGVGGDSWDTPSRRRELIEGQLSFFPQKEKFPTGKKKKICKTIVRRELTTENCWHQEMCIIIL